MRDSILRIFGLWWKEMVGILHDQGVLIFVVLVPLVYPLCYSWFYTNEVVRDVPFAVVDECNSQLSRSFVRQMDATPSAALKARCRNAEEAMELVKRREVYGIVYIPSSFEKVLWQGEQTSIQLYCEMSAMLYYRSLLIAASDVSLEMNRHIKVSRYLHPTTREEEKVQRMPVDYEYVSLYNPQSGFAAFLIPPVLMLILQQTLFLGIGMMMGGQRERYRTCAVRRCWPYRPHEVVAGKALCYLLLYVLLAIYMFSGITSLFGLPELGEYTDFLVFVIPYLLACIFMGMVLSFLVYRREDSIMLFVFLSVPLLFLSGISWPGAKIPLLLKYVSWLFPSTFGLNGYQLLRGTGATLEEIRPHIIALWIQSGVYGSLACLLYRWKMKRKI